jgi:hypothetical protein
MATPKPKYNNKELKEKIEEYFASNPDKPTVTGLAYFLGFESRQSLYDYKEREDGAGFVTDAINKAKRPQRKLGIKFKNHNQYNKEKYRKDPITNIRSRVNGHIRYHLQSKNGSAFKMLPYTPKQLKKSIESKFKDGMSWDNMDKWHIDHIIPASMFNFNSMDDIGFLQCYAIGNLQPMWAKDNLIKSNHLDKNNSQIHIGI